MHTRNQHPGPRRGGRRRSSGFSLLELALVVLMIAVLGALAAPRFANASARQRLEAAQRRVVADLHYAQTLAKSKSDTYTARFAADNTLTLVDPAGVTVAVTDYSAMPYEVEITAALGDAGTDMVFNGFGHPSTGGSVTLTGGDGSKIILDIDPVTGEVTRR